MNGMRFQSENQNIGIILDNVHIDEMHRLCKIAFPNETGGILIGKYSEDLRWAEIHSIIGPPIFSKRRRASFFRSSYGLKRILDIAWDDGNYYLGEWHFHPNAGSQPSSTDTQQMMTMSRNQHLHCPEPIIIIIGGYINSWNMFVAAIKDILSPLNAVDEPEDNLITRS
jgi:integrative and conjugative element protein (TIGR02256 family)